MKVLPVVVETKSVTRIGSTGVYFDYSAADIMTYKIPLQVDNNQLYYIPAIPATSFKGVLRSTYERFLRKRKAPNASLVNEAEIRKALRSEPSSDDLMKDLMRDLCKEINLFHDAGLLTEKCEIKEEGNYNEEELVKYLDLYFQVTGRNASESCYVTSDLDQCVNMSLIEDERKRREKSLWNKITRRENICKVCNLLGTSGVRGYVKFTDLVAVDPFPILLERETHVAINRVTGTSEKSKLFTEEIIPAGVKFLGFILILDDTKLEQITEALNVMKEKARFGEIWIGGRGTSGYGSFDLHFNEEVKFSEYSLLQGRSLSLLPREPGAPVADYGILGKIFPSSLLSSLLQGDSQVKYIVVDQEGKIREAQTTEELDRIISDLKARNLRYEVKAEGVVNL